MTRGRMGGITSLRVGAGSLPLRRFRLLWRKGGDDFFEARVAAQRVPNRIETQLALT